MIKGSTGGRSGASNERPPHPATVAQRREPSATASRPPHPATVAQRRELPATAQRPPHPATVAQGRGAPGAIQRSETKRKKISFDFKDVSKKTQDAWEITSTFGVEEERTVTLILGNVLTNNTFYSKHVLRKGEDPKKILKLRNSLKSQDWESYSEGFDFGINVTSGGVPASTVIHLSSNMQFEWIIFDIAQALVVAKEKGSGFSTLNAYGTVEVNFGEECVSTINKSEKISEGVGVELGGKLTAVNGDDWTFEVNHCGGMIEE